MFLLAGSGKVSLCRPLRWLVANQRETTGCKPMHSPNLAHTQRAARVKTASHSSQKWSKSKPRLPQPSTQTTILNFPSAAGTRKGADFQSCMKTHKSSFSCYCHKKAKKYSLCCVDPPLSLMPIDARNICAAPNDLICRIIKMSDEHTAAAKQQTELRVAGQHAASAAS